MSRITRKILLLYGCITVFPCLSPAQDFLNSVCRVAVYDEYVELEDSRIAVDLARSRFGAYEKIFKMIEGLWEGKTIPRMDYIKAKYDLDASRIQLEQNGLILERQSALLEQYRLICSEQDSEIDDLEEAIWGSYVKYRKADCGAMAKSIEVAETNLEYNREYLQNILKLRSENFATNTQVVMSELDVELEEKSLEDAKRRTSACRAELEEIEKGKRALYPDE
jgi:outer membrane protein TolC